MGLFLTGHIISQLGKLYNYFRENYLFLLKKMHNLQIVLHLVSLTMYSKEISCLPLTRFCSITSTEMDKSTLVRSRPHRALQAAMFQYL